MASYGQTPTLAHDHASLPSVITPKKTQPFTQYQSQESYQVFHQESYQVFHRESALIAYQINKRPVNAHSTAADGVKMAARFMCVTS